MDERREDIEITLAFLNFQRNTWGWNAKRGSREKAVGQIAKKRGISPGKVEEALGVLPSFQNNTLFGQ